MPLTTEDEIQKMHRYFAVECNNQAWDLADLDNRTDAQTEEMIRCAEVAAWHWSKIGKPINHARADMLLGWVFNLVGQSASAQSYTDSVRTQLAAKPEGTSEWDNAFLVLLDTFTRINAGVLSGTDEVSAGLDTARATLNNVEEQEVFDRFRAVVSL
jgi:hypothetical protein